MGQQTFSDTDRSGSFRFLVRLVACAYSFMRTPAAGADGAVLALSGTPPEVGVAGRCMAAGGALGRDAGRAGGVAVRLAAEDACHIMFQE